MNRFFSGSLLSLTTLLAVTVHSATAAEFRVPNDDQSSWSIHIEPAMRASSEVAERSAAYFSGEAADPEEPTAPALPVIQPASPDPFATQQPQPTEPDVPPVETEPVDAAQAEVTDPDLPVIIPQPVRRPSYMDVYSSIPFLRAEYMANPSYRHEATMEILFGELRPMTIHKYQPAVRPMAYPYGTPYVTPYWYTRDGYRVNYNFFYPRPTVYRNY